MLGWQDEEKIIGPVDVSGLEGSLEASDDARSGQRTSIPDIVLAGLDLETEQWLREWAATLGTQRNLVIRDQSKDRWLYVRRAMIRRYGMSNTHPVVVEEVSLSAAPDWPGW